MTSQPRTNSIVFADQSISSMIRRHQQIFRQALKNKETQKETPAKKYENRFAQFLYEKYDAVLNHKVKWEVNLMTPEILLPFNK